MEWCFFLVLAVWLDASRGHGSLNEPPSRASAWRHGFDTKPNYDDDGCYCGGFGVQWGINGGKCGICGDAWHLPEPRPHELGGAYGTGVIVRTFEEGDVIPVTVNLTTSHKGFWLLKLCTDADENNQECFDKITLQQSNGDIELYPDISRVYELEYKLPDGVTCEHCVIQWAYTAGNNWGYCDDGTSGLGCGPQENFRACADVSIQKSKTNVKTVNKISKQIQKTTVKIADQKIFEYPAIILNILDEEPKTADTHEQINLTVYDASLRSAEESHYKTKTVEKQHDDFAEDDNIMSSQALNDINENSVSDDDKED